MTSTIRYTKGPPRQMGKVTTRVVITNHFDEAAAARGQPPPSAVRSLTLDEVLVDTGATMLSLPADMVRALGLDLWETVDVSTATGVFRTGIYGSLTLEVEGRRAPFNCLQLPEGSPPLLGVTPLEVLGLEPDLREHRLRLLPDTGRDTYVLAL